MPYKTLEARRAYACQWRARNREKLRAKARVYYANNRAAKCTATRKRYAANPSKDLAKNQRWRAANRERINKRERERNARDRSKQRGHYLKHAYGLSLTEYDTLLAFQGGVCAICHNTETNYDPRARRTRRLAVDHQDEPFRVRGLLCQACNTALGLFKDNPALLRAAADYLNGFSFA